MIKRKITLWLTLILLQMTGLCIQHASATVTVGGVSVSNSNADNITSPAITSGKAWYDMASNTLVLESVIIDASKVEKGFKRGIQINGADMCERIVLYGANKIFFSSTPDADDSPICLFTNHDVDIIGSGTLQLQGGDYGIYAGNGKRLRLIKATININNTDLGIRANVPSAPNDVSIIDANLHYTPKTANGKCLDAGTLTLTYSKINTPSAASFQQDKHAIVKGGSVYNGAVDITSTSTDYKLLINGLRLSSYDLAYPTHFLLQSGSLSFSGNTLTLNNATLKNTMLTSDGINGVFFSSDLTISLKGSNIITGFRIPYHSNGIAKTTFEGNGSGVLTMHGDGTASGISMSNNLSIELSNCTMNIDGVSSGIQGNSSGNGLTINNSTLDITSNGICVSNIHVFSGADVGVSDPAGATYSNSKHSFVARNGSMVMGHLRIEPLNKYDIQIATIEVTNLNQDNVLGDGTVRYDPAYHCIYLENAKIPTGGINIGEKCKTALTISVKGDNEVSAGGYSAAPLSSSIPYLELKGDGTIRFKDGMYYGIYLNGTKLNIAGSWTASKGPNVYVTQTGSSNVGIYGSKGTESITIEKSYLNVFSEGMVMANLTAFTTIWNPITTPTGAYYDASIKRLVYDSGAVVKNDRLIIEEVEDYGIDVANVRINSKNWDNVKGSGISGHVSYDRATNTLFLNNATIEAENWGIVGRDNGEGNGFNIHIEGDNYVSGKQYNGICITNTWGSNKTRISGSGRLTVKSQQKDAFYMSSITTIEGIELVATSDEQAAYNANNTPLTVTNARFEAHGKQSAFTNLSELTLNGIVVVSPEDGYFESSLGGIANLSGKLCADVVIDKKPVVDYHLIVGDVYVNSENCAAITGTDVTGTVSFDPTTWTLTLTNATIAGNGIYAATEGASPYIGPELNIVVNGDNEVKSPTGYPLYLQVNTTITGYGTLNSVGENDKPDIYMSQPADLTIGPGTTVNVAQMRGTDGTLTVDHATIHGTGFLTGFADVVLNGVDFITPNSACYDKTLKQLPNREGTATVGFEIGEVEYYGIWVGDVQANSLNRANIKDDLISGSVKYDPDTHTLTFNSATLSMESSPIKISPTDYYVHMKSAEYSGSSLNVEVLGENDYTRGDFILAKIPITFKGTGTMTVKTIELSKGSSLTVSGDCMLNASSIFGNGDNTVSVLENASLNLAGKISNVSNLVLGEGLAINAPEGAYFDAAEAKVLDADGNPAMGIAIGAKITVDYGLMVGDVAVTSDNAKAITGTDITGSVSFDPATWTLTLTDATIAGDGIYAATEGSTPYKGTELNIVVNGDNEVKSPTGYPLHLQVNTTIAGPGTLKAVGDNDKPDIFMSQPCNLTIGPGTTVSVAQIKGTEGILTVDHATVQGTGFLYGFADVVLNGVGIITPNSVCYDKTIMRLTDKQGDMAKGFEIGEVEYYGVWIADVQANSVNSSAMTSDQFSGSAYYDNTTHTLTLDGIELEPYAQPIRISPDGLTYQQTATYDGSELNIVLKGDNKLNAGNGYDYKAKVSTSIKGKGTLDIYIIELAAGTSLSITDEAEVSTTYVKGSGSNTVSVDGATLKMTDNFRGGIEHLVLGSTTGIVTPKKGVFDESAGFVWDGDIRASGVLIRPYTEEELAGVKTITADGAAPRAVYNTQGLRTDSMRRGVNIVRQADGTTRKLLRK